MIVEKKKDLEFSDFFLLFLMHDCVRIQRSPSQQLQKKQVSLVDFSRLVFPIFASDVSVQERIPNM